VVGVGLGSIPGRLAKVGDVFIVLAVVIVVHVHVVAGCVPHIAGLVRSSFRPRHTAAQAGDVVVRHMLEPPVSRLHAIGNGACLSIGVRSKEARSVG
jgi:hypothetical protein